MTTKIKRTKISKAKIPELKNAVINAVISSKLIHVHVFYYSYALIVVEYFVTITFSVLCD